MVAERVVELKYKAGLHLRPAMKLAELAASFDSGISIAIEPHEKEADAKSIISLLTLGAEKGSRLAVRAKGHDAEQALEAIEALITSGFGL